MCVCEGVGRAAGPQRGWGGRTCDGRLTVQSIGRAAPRTASPEPHTGLSFLSREIIYVSSGQKEFLIYYLIYYLI